MKKINVNLHDHEICKYISEINKKGWLDSFSNEHFLIKALNGDMDYFYKYKSLIKGSLYYAKEDINANNFIMNFSTKFSWFCNHFTEREMNKFVVDQLSAGKNNYKEEQFFRAISEINVLNFLMSFGPAKLKQAIYEPKLGVNKSNPEARLIYSNGITVDVEVKTPGFNKTDYENKKGILLPTILLEDKEKIVFEKLCKKKEIEFVLPRVGKLKDYINSAGKKFEKPKDKNHVNLLYINWTYTDIERRGYLEPYSLLYNNLNGLLKNKEAALNLGISEEALEKISAIVVYQDSFDSIIFGDFRYLWNGYFFRLLPNELIDSNLVDIDIIRNVTNMNPPAYKDNIMPYEMVVKEKHLKEAFEVTDFINRRIKAKIIVKEDNFTYYTKEYHKKMIKQGKRKEKQINALRKSGYILN